MTRGEIIRRLFAETYLSVRDPGYRFGMKEIRQGESRTTVWRLLRSLVLAGMLQRVGRYYAVSPGFRKELAEKLKA